jgi:hypothetical protein
VDLEIASGRVRPVPDLHVELLQESEVHRKLSALCAPNAPPRARWPPAAWPTLTPRRQGPRPGPVEAGRSQCQRPRQGARGVAHGKPRTPRRTTTGSVRVSLVDSCIGRDYPYVVSNLNGLSGGCSGSALRGLNAPGSSEECFSTLSRMR